MWCYNCGSELTRHSFCTNCGVDVSLYKKIVGMSNFYYNEGLDKANVRDLSGAVVSLRQCLRLYKNHVDARNLLGLVYFEMGETVAALSEWVISKNLRPNKNIADSYIEMVQSNAGKLETINQTIKKYNQALTYCEQGSLDLAMIQLKKVLSMNPQFLQAHLLLALLFIQYEEWEKALRELRKCMKVDKNNTMTLRYLKLVNSMMNNDEAPKTTRKKVEIKDDIIKYQSGNETIIQPVNVKEPKTSRATILNLFIGAVIGLAVGCALILPAQMSSARAKANEEMNVLREQLDARTASVSEMEQQVNSLNAEKEQLSSQLANYEGTEGSASQSVTALLSAANACLDDPEDTQAIADYLDQIDAADMGEGTSEAYTTLYRSLIGKVGPELAKDYYDKGEAAYRSGAYDDAVGYLTRAVVYDEDNENAWLVLANTWRNMENSEKAIETYQKIQELFPESTTAGTALTALEEIEAEG